MKFLLLISLLLTGCNVNAANDISIKNESTFEVDNKVIGERHVVITFTKVSTCTVSVELPKTTPIKQFMSIVFEQRQK